jgi:hypothetical protein
MFVVSKILGARYNKQVMFHELLVAWHSFQVGETTWESYSVMAVDVSEIKTKFMESHDDPERVSEIQSLEFSWESVMLRLG